VKRFVALATTIGGSALLSISGATAYAGSSALAQAGGPMIRITQGGVTAAGVPTISENWSGYAATSSKKFNGVSSTYVQPAVTCPGKPKQYTSNWVGLDGFNDQTVEQDGTFAFCGGPGSTTPKYVAWYEMYPAGSVEVFHVKPGDVMHASVEYAGGKFTLTITDTTSGKTATDVASCSSCARASAEWIIERPAGCNAAFTKCFLFALADFGTTTMSSDVASTGGPWRSVAAYKNNYPIYMIQPLKSGGFVSLDTVGPVDTSTNSFTAVWDRSGHPTPISLGPSQ
jgi:hypothetical protein